MKYDYDLVILGQRPAAIAAAESAVSAGARVAVVVSPDRERPPETAQLALAGVDVVCARAELYKSYARARPRKRSPLELRAHLSDGRRDRRFRSRAYLLVPDARVAVPSWPGLDAMPSTTIATAADIERGLCNLGSLSNLTEGALPQRAIVHGGRSLWGLELALGLLERGVETRIVTADRALLPSECPNEGSNECPTADVSPPAQLWQLVAAARGLTYSCDCEIVRCDLSGDREIQLHTTEGAYTADRLFLTERLVPDFDPAFDPALYESLKSCGVAFAGDFLWVDRYLRTAHPQVFACAAALRGYDAESIATHEALVATRNALATRWQYRSPRYDAIAWGVNAHPGYARVGRVGAQVEAQVGATANAITLDISVRDRHAGDWMPDIAARVVVSETGQILGATIAADRAADLIVPFSHAIAQRASIETWRTWAGMASGSSDLWSQLELTWRDRCRDARPHQHDRAKTRFDDRRS